MVTLNYQIEAVLTENESPNEPFLGPIKCGESGNIACN